MKTRYIVAAVLLSALFSCAKDPSTGKNDSAKREFDAIVSQRYATMPQTPLGSVILHRTDLGGEKPGDNRYLRANITYYTLDNELVYTTDSNIARKANQYDATRYYGPIFCYRGEKKDNLGAGLEEAFAMMGVGDSLRILIPGWLSEAERYSSKEGYLKHCSGTNYIYDLKLEEVVDSTSRWEKQQIKDWLAVNYPDAEENMDIKYYDGTTLPGGLWYIRTKEGLSDKSFRSDSTIYINYTGRRLDGVAFDTTIENIAIDNYIWSSSATYEPTQINWSEESYSNITMGSDENSIITGFAYALSLMHPYESGIAVFISIYGYSSSGSGGAIPPYCPLCFEIEMTDAPE